MTDDDRMPGCVLALLLGLLATAVLWVVAVVTLYVTSTVTDGFLS